MGKGTIIGIVCAVGAVFGSMIMEGGNPASLMRSTDCGPPERMIAVGRLARMSATLAVCGMISEKTRASRTRRAISWAY